VTSLDIITNLQGFEDALEEVKSKAGEVKEVRLAVTRKVAASELGASQAGATLLIGCNAADKYMVGVAIMSVFDQVPQEHVTPTTKYNEEMLRLVKRQTTAMEDIAKILRARA
jgi:hypothetical protein